MKGAAKLAEGEAATRRKLHGHCQSPETMPEMKTVFLKHLLMLNNPKLFTLGNVQKVRASPQKIHVKVAVTVFTFWRLLWIFNLATNVNRTLSVLDPAL